MNQSEWCEFACHQLPIWAEQKNGLLAFVDFCVMDAYGSFVKLQIWEITFILFKVKNILC